MPDRPAPDPPRDWRDEESYKELDRVDRRGFAWEYLRRNPDYRKQREPDREAAAQTTAVVTILRAKPDTIPSTWGLRFR